MCEFCDELRAPDSAGSRIVWRDDMWATVPTRGCFVAGYSLLLPMDHLISFGSAAVGDLAGAERAVERLRSLVASAFGPAIVAEHGASVCDMGASCCDHAHLHVIPVPSVEAVGAIYVAQFGSPQRLGALRDLKRFADAPYLYLSPKAGEHFVWTNGRFPRQFVRRVCAQLHGIPAKFDWRLFPFEGNMVATCRALRDRLRESAAA
jgi:diadenosine tetraphosphate (Ap4A) HIT family hydrolase